MLMKEKNRDSCEFCRFWDDSASSGMSEDITGECRRRPPGFDDRTRLAVFPFTTEDDWCGDFVENPRAAAEAED